MDKQDLWGRLDKAASTIDNYEIIRRLRDETAAEIAEEKRQLKLVDTVRLATDAERYDIWEACQLTHPMDLNFYGGDDFEAFPPTVILHTGYISDGPGFWGTIAYIPGGEPHYVAIFHKYRGLDSDEPWVCEQHINDEGY